MAHYLFLYHNLWFNKSKTAPTVELGGGTPLCPLLTGALFCLQTILINSSGSFPRIYWNDKSGSNWDFKMKGEISGLKNRELIIFFSSSIKLLISSQGSTEDLAWYLPGVTWNLFPIVHQKVMNDEPESHHSRSLFFMSMTCFSENGFRRVSLIQNAWERKQLSLTIVT